MLVTRRHQGTLFSTIPHSNSILKSCPYVCAHGCMCTGAYALAPPQTCVPTSSQPAAQMQHGEKMRMRKMRIFTRGPRERRNTTGGGWRECGGGWWKVQGGGDLARSLLRRLRTCLHLRRRLPAAAPEGEHHSSTPINKCKSSRRPLLLLLPVATAARQPR